MADRRALVITSPGIMSLQDAAELIPGPGEVVARPVHTGLAGNGVTVGFPIDDVVNNGSRSRRTRRPTRCCEKAQAREARSSWT